jgi:hypothetical protein
MAVNRLTGGDWLFFMPQIRYTLSLAQPGRNVWWIADPFQWIPVATYVVLPALFMVAGLGVAARRTRGSDSRVQISPPRSGTSTGGATA